MCANTLEHIHIQRRLITAETFTSRSHVRWFCFVRAVVCSDGDWQTFMTSPPSVCSVFACVLDVLYIIWIWNVHTHTHVYQCDQPTNHPAPPPTNKRQCLQRCRRVSSVGIQTKRNRAEWTNDGSVVRPVLSPPVGLATQHNFREKRSDNIKLSINVRVGSSPDWAAAAKRERILGVLCGYGVQGNDNIYVRAQLGESEVKRFVCQSQRWIELNWLFGGQICRSWLQCFWIGKFDSKWKKNR